MNGFSNIVYAFIDSQNLNLGVRSLGWKLDFGKFRVYLKDKYNVSEAFLFLGYVESNRKLYIYLTSVGYELVFKPTVRDFKGRVKGNVDAELVLQTMIEVENFDKAIIVSGDGDFYCLIKYLIGIGKLDKVITPNWKYSSLLKEFGNKIVPIKGLGKKLRKK
ncbi:NYN domain-containing protein [bacterium]|nr:NYN domain-containing protein [bacterium]